MSQQQNRERIIAMIGMQLGSLKGYELGKLAEMMGLPYRYDVATGNIIQQGHVCGYCYAYSEDELTPDDHADACPASRFDQERRGLVQCEKCGGWYHPLSKPDHECQTDSTST